MNEISDDSVLRALETGPVFAFADRPIESLQLVPQSWFCRCPLRVREKPI